MEAKFFNKKEEDGSTRLYFYLKKGSIADTNAVPFEFEGLANENHKKVYTAQFQSFLDAAAKAAEPVVVVKTVAAEVLGTEKPAAHQRKQK